MRRLSVVLGTVLGLLAGALVVTAPGASATGTLTVYGPATLPLNSTLTLGGHTPQPGQAVYLHYRVLDNGSSTSYSYTGPVHSDSQRSYHVQLPFPFSADYSYYATSNGARTQVHVVRVARTTCTTSGPAFTKLPVSGAHFGTTAFGTFTATRGGVWAGEAVGGPTFAVLRWSARDGLVDLGNFDYQSARGISFEDTAPGSVDVVGITPYGSVVASVEDPAGSGAEWLGYVWTPNGVRHRLRTPATWHFVKPVGVADDGRIFGVTRDSGEGLGGVTRLVSWANAYAQPVVLTTLHGPPAGSTFVDHAGDLIYRLPDSTTHVRLASGQVRALATPFGGLTDADPVAAAGHRVYASSFGGIVQWDLTSVPPSGPLTATLVATVNGRVHGAGRDGDLTVDNGVALHQRFVPHHLITAARHYADIPPRDQRDLAEAVDYRGTVAYTSATDHLPHFRHCA